MLKEGAEAEAAIADARRSSVSRHFLRRRPRFEHISPDVGRLDEEAFDDALAADPDAALALLADMTRATDAELRRLAQRLAGRLMLDVARRGPARPRGTGRIVEARYRSDLGDLDLEASTEAIVEARAASAAVDVERLRIRRWVQPSTAVCLLVDRSGSMGGRPVATSAVAAAAVAYRAPDEFSVVSFARDAVVLKPHGVPMPVETVVDRVLALRGHGTTDLANALRAAGEQLGRSHAGRRLVVLLSDCRATEPGDVLGAARDLEELVIVAPAGDAAEASALAAETGATMTTVRGPADVADALARAIV